MIPGTQEEEFQRSSVTRYEYTGIFREASAVGKNRQRLRSSLTGSRSMLNGVRGILKRGGAF